MPEKDNANPAAARAQQLLREKRYADALQVCNDELARGADEAELRLVAAQSLLAQGRQEGAKKEAQQAVRLDPTLAEAHRVLAEVACTRGELAIARDHLNRVLELDPDDDKSRALLESLSRPVGAAAARPMPPGPPPLALQDRVPTASTPERNEESGALELSSDDLEEEIEEESDDVEVAEPPSARPPPPLEAQVEAPVEALVEAHVDPFSGQAFPLGDEAAVREKEAREREARRKAAREREARERAERQAEQERAEQERAAAAAALAAALDRRPGEEVPVSDSMILELPAKPMPRLFPDQPPSIFEQPQSPPLFDQAPTKVQMVPPDMSDDARPDAGDAWKPSMDAGAGTGLKYEGTLRLPALDDLPEEEDAPTMPLLRPSGPPKPQLRLDPMAASPIEERPLGWRPAAAEAPPARPPGPRVDAPIIGPPLAGRGLLSDSDGDEPMEPPSAQAQPRSQRRTAEGAPLWVEDAQPAVKRAPQPEPEESESEDLLSLMSGGQRPAQAPRRQQRPTGPAQSIAEAARQRGREPPSFDPAFEAPTGDNLLDGLMASAQSGVLTAEDIERQIAAATGGALLDTGEREISGKLTRTKVLHRPPKPGKLRWVVVAVVGLVLGGGGLAGYLFYRSWKYVEGEWTALREAVHRSTPEGYRDARAAGERLLKHRKNDPKAAAAIAMCDAAMSIEFGDDRLKSARDLLERSRGTDSEWRTGANAFLALMEDPARAEGYLQKGLEVYPQSAILHYLRGRALASGETPEKAAEAHKAALRLAPKFAAARIALAGLEGQSAAAYGDSVRALDEIIASDKDSLQALIERARLRVRHRKDLDEAAIDARRVTTDLAANAGRGQIGWAHLVLAQVAALGGQAATAGEELDEAIKSPPCCDSGFRHELAAELMNLFRMGQAEAQMKEALALKPKQAEYLQRMARVLLELDDPVAALVQLQNTPARALETRLLTGRAHFAQGSYGTAAAAFNMVLAENKDHLEASLYAELTRARRGSSAEALAALGKLAQANPQDPSIQKAIGKVHLWAGDLAKADSVLVAAWKMRRTGGKDPEVATLLGLISARKQAVQMAVKRFNRALEARPEYRPARVGLARLLIGVGKLAEARQQLGLVAESDRGKPDVRALEARLALAEGKLEAARSALSEAASSGLAEAEAARLTGELALAMKDGKTADEALKKARKLGGKDGELLALIGRAELLTKKVDDAYESFHDALKEDPGQPIALLELGRIAVNDGEHPLAVKRLNDALARMKEREYPASQRAVVSAALGAAFLKHKDTGRAITNLEDAIEADASAAEPQFLMGQTYDRLDKPNRAAQFYLKALQLDPGRTDVYEYLGKAYAKMGEPENAVKYYEAFLKSNPPAVKAKAVQAELRKLQK